MDYKIRGVCCGTKILLQERHEYQYEKGKVHISNIYHGDKLRACGCSIVHNGISAFGVDEPHGFVADTGGLHAVRFGMPYLSGGLDYDKEGNGNSDISALSLY